MKKYILIILFIICCLPNIVFALSEDYEDRVHEILDKEVEEGKINIYFFRGEGCPHCAQEEEWLKSIQEEYEGKINVYDFEIWHNDKNKQLLQEVKDEIKPSNSGIPFTVIGNEYFIGFSETTSSKMENTIKDYLDLEHEKDSIKLPILGKVNVKKVSLPIVAIVLGFIDGFNPCAMWILLFLINMLFREENKKKSWILGFTFLIVSGLVYFISMLGINLVVGVIALKWIKICLALFILGAGIYNFIKYLKTRKEEEGCTVVDSKKRKNISSKMKKILASKSFILAMLGISILAASVNLIELACSLGFPLVFAEILSINNITGITKIIYLLVYILFYMIDDIVVFTISMFTLQATGITNKYNKLCTLVSAIIMIIMGVLLLVKPDWLMLNF